MWLWGCGAKATADDEGPTDPEDRVTITQGIWGTVLWLEGDHMPGPEIGGTTEPLATEVRIHAITTEAEAEEVADRDAYGLYTNITTEIVASVRSDPEGFYEVDVPPGTYSVFAEDGGDWYCNGFGPDGICTVDVTEGAVTPYRISIDYMASF